MSQIDGLIRALKSALKEKKMTYRDVANELGLSESTIKRILTNKSISLDRIEHICRWADLRLSDLMKVSQEFHQEQGFLFSVQQEQAFSDNYRLLHFYLLLSEGLTPQKIEEEYDITTKEVQKFLFKLDKLELIELHLLNKVRIKMRGPYKFRPQGPLGREIFLQMKSGFFDYPFTTNDCLNFSVLKVSPALLTKYRRKFENIFAELQDEAQFESSHYIQGQNTGFLFSFHPWSYSFMQTIKPRNSLNPQNLLVKNSALVSMSVS